MIIRNEQKEDMDAVEQVIRNAFWNVYKPGATEHFMAHKMRLHKDFVNELNMVAEVDGEIVGSIMYTNSSLVCEDGTSKTCLTFGPIAVRPDYQRKGIGKALIEKTFELAKDMGYDSVVIYGNPGNYVSRGFISCYKANVCIENGVYPTALLVKPLTDNAFDGRRWVFTESGACEVDEKDAEEYDKLFPARVKKILPCQEEFYIYSHSRIFG